MAAERVDIEATLAAWQAQGAAQFDPVGLIRIRALHARAQRAHGAVAEALQAQLAQQVQRYASRLSARTEPAPLSRAGLDALSALVAGLGQGQGQGLAAAPVARAGALPVLDGQDALLQSRRTWNRLHTQSQLRRSLEQLPVDAGPLNSAVLAHRALSLMQDASPAFAEHFVSYVDTLASLELLSALRPSRASDASQVGARPGKAPRKPRRKKSESS